MQCRDPENHSSQQQRSSAHSGAQNFETEANSSPSTARSDARHGSADGRKDRQFWTSEEDEKMLRMVYLYGPQLWL